MALVLAVLAASCAPGDPAGPATRSAADAPTRSTTTTAPGRPTLERVAAEPGVLAAQGDQRMVAVAADAAGSIAVAVGSDGDGPALWRASSPDVWLRLPTPDEMPATARLADVAVSATGLFMVVGEVDGLGAAWTSTDASMWRRADVDRGPPIEHVADTAVGPVAFSVGDEPVPWKSWDGQVWLRAGDRPSPDGGGGAARVVGVADVDGGVLAVIDRSGGGPAMWGSADGFSWSATRRPVEELFGTTGGLSVGAVLAGRGAQIEVGGSVRDGFGLDAAIWRSADGRTWEQASPDLNVFGGDGAQEVTAMVSDPDGRSVAVGTDLPEGGEEADVAVWTSSAGGSWSRADPESLRRPGHQHPRDAVVFGGAVVAVGHERLDGEDDAAVWKVGSVAVEPPAPIEGPTMPWRRVDADALGAPGEQRLEAVTATPDGYVAVGAARSPLEDPGSEGPSREVGPVEVGPSDGAAWFSPDARSWERVDVAAFDGDGDQELLAVASGPDALVAVGRDGDGAAAWRSTDGREWRRVPDPDGVFGGGGLVARGVVAIAGGFLAVGSDGVGDAGDGVVWASDDGRSWRRIGSEVFGGPGAQVMRGIALGVDRVVVVGSDGDQAAAWTSSDLVDWRHEVLGAGLASAVAGLDGSVVAVGAAPGDDGQLDARSWRLAGDAWEQGVGPALSAPGNQQPLGVALGGDLAVAVGVTDFGGGDDAASWASNDALSWQPTPHDENILGGSGAQQMTAVVTDGDTAVAVGWSGSAPEARDAVVWVADQVGVTGPSGRL